MIDINDLKPFPKFCYSIGYIPTSYKVSMTYEEQLIWLCDYLQNTVIPTVNQNGHAVEELQNLYVELKQYVDDYFSDLNVQTEINNKLDDMAESGELADIINEQIFEELNAQVQTNSSDIDTLETNLTNLENKRNPIDFYSGKNFVVFGDSFSQPLAPNSEDEYWVKQVAGATGMTRFNFAVSGAGFSRADNLLSSQLTRAQNEMTLEQKQNTSIVIVYAGYNDITTNETSESILDNYVALITGIANSFPKAKIIVAPFNWGYGSLSRDQNDKIETLMMRMCRDTSLYPVTFLKLARYWLLGVPTQFRNAGHPSVNGYKIIASYMLGAIYGSSEHVSIGGWFQPNHGSRNINTMTMKDGWVHLNFGIQFASDVSDYSTEQFTDLPALLCPETDIIVPLYSGQEGFVGTLRLANDGNGYLTNVNLPANTWALATATFPAQAWKTWQS